MMKKALTVAATTTLFVVFTGVAFALPTNEQKGENNPQVVAHYQTGTHGIPGEYDTHTGVDLVKRNGNSGNFQQWFYGESASEGKHGEHSLWKVSKDGTCAADWITVPNASANWGDYLLAGATYCVKTNDYQ